MNSKAGARVKTPYPPEGGMRRSRINKFEHCSRFNCLVEKQSPYQGFGVILWRKQSLAQRTSLRTAYSAGFQNVTVVIMKAVNNKKGGEAIPND